MGRDSLLSVWGAQGPAGPCQLGLEQYSAAEQRGRIQEDFWMDQGGEGGEKTTA